MAEARWLTTLRAPWNDVPSVRVDGTTNVRFDPQLHVGVLAGEEPLFRIDVASDDQSECHAFEEVLLWRGWVAIGCGAQAHLVSVENRSVRSFPLGDYFGSFCPGEEFLLVASAARLYRLEPDGELLWRTEPLGLDGVLVHGVEAGVISGDGEWDPPGGWQPFTVDLASGAVLAQP